MSTSNRITLKLLEAAVAKEEYHVSENGRTTYCELTMHNGHVCMGHASVVDIENNDPEIGHTSARDNARDELSIILAFLIRERMYMRIGRVPSWEPYIHL